MSALSTIAEAIARLEYKLDLVIRFLMPNGNYKPMHFFGHECPVCKNTVDYQIDMANKIVVRKCNCKSGKIPVEIEIPLVPVGKQATEEVESALLQLANQKEKGK